MDSRKINFYANPENLRDILGHFLSIFSEGHQPNVPYINNLDGSLNIIETFKLACYKDFPEIERKHWLSYVHR